jgi:hypothetical protein
MERFSSPVEWLCNNFLHYLPFGYPSTLYLHVTPLSRRIAFGQYGICVVYNLFIQHLVPDLKFTSLYIFV